MPIAEKATENRELVFPYNKDGAKDNSITMSTVRKKVKEEIKALLRYYSCL